MFTGIVSDVGTIASVEERGDLRVAIHTAFDPAGIDLGASIACSGVCLTVVDKGARDDGGEGGGGWFAVDVSGETRSRTPESQWTTGRRLNLERALKLGDELGGHMVTGHVDGTGVVRDVRDVGGSREVTVTVPAEVAPFLAGKGSVTVDGVSLTVNEVHDRPDGTQMRLNIIPHTGEVTTLGALAAGDAVNLEIDVLARYLQRLESYRAR